MEDQPNDDPWAELRKASQKPEAGRFSYDDHEVVRQRDEATSWEWIKLWFKDDVLRWVRNQFPNAEKTLDSSYYLGFTRQKKAARRAVKSVVTGKETEKEMSRTPVILFGHRVGIPGASILTVAGLITLGIIRTVFGF